MAEVLRPHGLRGELRVHAFAAGAPNLQRGSRVYAGDRQLTITASREDRGAWLLTFSGVTDRQAAEALRGALLEAPDDAIRRDDPESYFLYELIGLEVVTPEGRSLGRVTEVLQPGANDVYVVDGPAGEVLVPAIADVVQQVDLAAGRIIITPLSGMLDVSQ